METESEMGKGKGSMHGKSSQEKESGESSRGKNPGQLDSPNGTVKIDWHQNFGEETMETDKKVQGRVVL